MQRRYFFALLAGLIVALLFAIVFKVSNPVSVGTQSQSTTLLVGAAASLQNVLKELDPMFEKNNLGIRVNYNFAASGPLQQQIEQGAPIDLFIAAATRPMDALQKKNLIVANTRRNLLTNRLVLVVPHDSRSSLTTFQQLANPNVKRISVGERRSVPAGQYAEEVFQNLGILDSLRSKFVYGNSVRSVLGTVESGNADAGVVYATDARISERVKAIATAPQSSHSPIVYPMAVVAASQNQQAAQAYAQFLTSKPAQAVFKRYGFALVREGGEGGRF